jgi:hypothetical protein
LIREPSITFQSEITETIVHPVKASTEKLIDLHKKLSITNHTATKFRKLEFNEMYEEVGIIGQGGHAMVKKCRKRNNSDPLEYAVKIFRSGDPEIINTIKKTFQSNQVLKHNNVC